VDPAVIREKVRALATRILAAVGGLDPE
jgi:hypothetical protein